MTQRELKISMGNCKAARFWSNKTVTFEALCEKLRAPVRTAETVAEYAGMPKKDRDRVKDRGGFVMAHLRDNRRLAANVVCRSALVYDCDQATEEFCERLPDYVPFAGVAYGTHSYTRAKRRIRLIIPLTRDLSPDEHGAVSRLFAANFDFIQMADPCSFMPQQMMYWPSVSSDGEYFFRILEGDALDPDDVLASCPDWRDCSLLPTAPGESCPRPHTGESAADPLTKKGPVGLFCRTFTIRDAIGRFLSDVYEPCGEGRFTYKAGESTGGVVVYENDTFAYSFHATDPAGGRLLNAFDLVRIHRFPAEEESVSFREMSAFVMELPEIRILAAKERAGETAGSPEGNGAEVSETRADDRWMGLLEYDSRGAMKSSLHNLILILENDPALKGIVFNRLSDDIEIRSEVPWRHPSGVWRDADDAQLVAYIDTKYGNFGRRSYDIAVTKVADDRAYHPIREYMEKLPPWDGVPRAETYFIDYLGADDSPYIRAVTRKTLLAAYRRIYDPGTKFDSCVVISGGQGIGKSTAIARLGMEWYSDSLTLSDMSDKTAAEKLQGYWIMEIGELAGMRKADMEKVKAFISRVDDKYRAAFGRRVVSHPRQCVMIGTTNADGYLRDITGNRRFWVVNAKGNAKLCPWEITRDVIDQLWAEVKTFPGDEPLYLPPALRTVAERAQAEAMETDERQGLVAKYLDTLLPENWEEMDQQERVRYFRDPEDPTRPEGVRRRETVSNIEIWCECFGRFKEDLQPKDSYAITAMMIRVDGWEKTDERPYLKHYGCQRIYRRFDKPGVF